MSAMRHWGPVCGQPSVGGAALCGHLRGGLGGRDQSQGSCQAQGVMWRGQRVAQGVLPRSTFLRVECV